MLLENVMDKLLEKQQEQLLGKRLVGQQGMSGSRRCA